MKRQRTRPAKTERKPTPAGPPTTTVRVQPKLKEMLGFAEGDKIDVVDEKFREDMETYASTLTNEIHHYRQAIQVFHDTVLDIKQQWTARRPRG